MATKPVQYTTYLDGELFAKLEAIAKADDRSVSYIIQKAAYELVGKQEHVVKWRQTDLEDAIAQAVKAGPVTYEQKRAKARAGMAARAVRMADRMAKKK